jgi:hypothetical protein
MITEADTCRKYVLPKLEAAGWDAEPHSFTEQKTFTDGRIVIARGARGKRRDQKRADYLLRYTRDFLLAVVEAKPAYKTPGDGLQQAKEYAEMLGLKFAYATNGTGIVEFDYTTGLETELGDFPSPQELWARFVAHAGLTDGVAARLLTPFNDGTGKQPRYYQELAVNRVVQAVLQGDRRVLLTMATGTGKTVVAFQICWKLWASRWTRAGEGRRPRILYLADRNILVDDPKDKIFTPFGDARWKIEGGQANKGRELYFAIYQAIAEDEGRPGLYREYAPDFFDLIVVDECHRGSAQEGGSWRDILEYFAPAAQLGMTATPLRADNKDTYEYFGNQIYQYSLKQGIADGFLAPYLLAQMNLLLHGLEAPQITPDNSLKVKVTEIGDRDRVDIILTNPPFGGEEERGILGNFPDDKQTAETALLFMQLIMRKLRRQPRPGRAAVVVPNGLLFGDGIAARVKEDLLLNYNLHTVVRLPNGVFAPYTSIPTNLLFFDRSGATEEIWYYELPPPAGRKNYSKTVPMQYEEFGDCLAWWNDRVENDRAWRVDIAARIREARAAAAPHWEAAEQADAKAKELAREIKEVNEQLQRLKREEIPLLRSAAPAGAADREAGKLEACRAALQSAEAAARERARAEQAAGDALYWPVFNLDLKNPSAKQDFEHLPPEQLADDILRKEQRIAELMAEIKLALAEGGEP